MDQACLEGLLDALLDREESSKPPMDDLPFFPDQLADSSDLPPRLEPRLGVEEEIGRPRVDRRL